METFKMVFFNSLPSFIEVEKKFKEYTKLDIDIERKEYGIYISAIHFEKGLDTIRLYNEERERKGNSSNMKFPDGNYLLLYYSAHEINYMQGVMLKVLKDFGGSYENQKQIEIPFWANEEWKGSIWWRDVLKKIKWDRLFGFFKWRQ